MTGLQQGSSSRGLTSGGTRFSRTSSQSSGSGGKKKGYNLRSRPVHSTPRDSDSEQHHQRKTTKRKQHGEIDEEEDEEEEEDGDHKRPQHYLKKGINYVKKILHSPIHIFDTVWSKLKLLPLWLLIPLLLILGLYACKSIIYLSLLIISCFFLVPNLAGFACKPLGRFIHPKVKDVCHDVQHFTSDLGHKSYNFTRRHTFDRGLRNIKQVYGSANDIKNSVLSSLSDLYYSTKGSLSGSVGDVRHRVSDAVETTAENAKEYYDAGIKKVNHLIEELKQEREKLLGA